MTVTIELSPDEERRLRDRATQLGQDPASYVRRLIREALEAAAPERHRTFAEILAPIHEEFRQGGMSEDQLDTLLEGSLDEARAEKRQGKNPGP